MENTSTQNPFQALIARAAEEAKDALAAMRAAESAVQFELEARRLELVIRELEWWSWEGA